MLQQYPQQITVTDYCIIHNTSPLKTTEIPEYITATDYGNTHKNTATDYSITNSIKPLQTTVIPTEYLSYELQQFPQNITVSVNTLCNSVSWLKATAR